MKKNFKGEDLKLAALTKYNYKEGLHFWVWSVPLFWWCKSYKNTTILRGWSVDFLLSWDSFRIGFKFCSWFFPPNTYNLQAQLGLHSKQTEINIWFSLLLKMYFYSYSFLNTIFFHWEIIFRVQIRNQTIVINDLSHINWNRMLPW